MAVFLFFQHYIQKSWLRAQEHKSQFQESHSSLWASATFPLGLSSLVLRLRKLRFASVDIGVLAEYLRNLRTWKQVVHVEQKNRFLLLSKLRLLLGAETGAQRKLSWQKHLLHSCCLHPSPEGQGLPPRQRVRGLLVSFCHVTIPSSMLCRESIVLKVCT